MYSFNGGHFERRVDAVQWRRAGARCAGGRWSYPRSASMPRNTAGPPVLVASACSRHSARTRPTTVNNFTSPSVSPLTNITHPRGHARAGTRTRRAPCGSGTAAARCPRAALPTAARPTATPTGEPCSSHPHLGHPHRRNPNDRSTFFQPYYYLFVTLSRTASRARVLVTDDSPPLAIHTWTRSDPAGPEPGRDSPVGAAADPESQKLSTHGQTIPVTGRGLHLFTSQLNLSVFYGIGVARRGCVSRVKGVLGGA